jgi:hypothetical protein
VVEQAGSSTTTGVVVNLGTTALTGTAVNTASSAFVSQGTSVASNTATYLFNGDNSTNASIVDTLTGIENVTGSDLADYIVGSATANTITGGDGNDVVTGGAGIDNFVFEATSAANGVDTVTDFATGAGGDTIEINVTLADLHGTGAVAVSIDGGETYNANGGFYIAEDDIADVAAMETFTEALVGEADGDIAYFLGSTDADASAVVTLYRVEANGAGDTTNVALATIGTFDLLADFTADNLADYAAIV